MVCKDGRVIVIYILWVIGIEKYMDWVNLMFIHTESDTDVFDDIGISKYLVVKIDIP